MKLEKFFSEITGQTPFCPSDIFPHLGEERDGGLCKKYHTTYKY